MSVDGPSRAVTVAAAAHRNVRLPSATSRLRRTHPAKYYQHYHRRPTMTAQVQSKPIDLTDNKQKDDPQMTALGSGCYGYHIEANRLRSFSNWPVAYINKAELARYGFYYVGPNDMVKCFFCRVEIGLWEQQDSVLQEHLRWSPYCALLKKRPTNNVPLDSSFLDQLPVPSYDTCGIQIRMHSQQENAYVADRHSTGSSSGASDSSLSSPPSSLSPPMNDWTAAAGGLPMRRPDYPNFAIEAKRLESYEEWPKFMKQKPKELSDAGFFYTGQGDRVKCFSCGGGLKDWEQDDDPWEQHTMWYGNCEYVRLMKGADYVAACQRKKDGLTAASSAGGNGAEMSEPSTSGIGSVASTASSASSVGSGSPASTGCCSSPRPPSADGGLSDGEDDSGARRSAAISDTKICKICFVNEYNTAFLPCGHVVACAKCASSVTKCPLCQQPFMNVLRVYLS